MPTQLIKAIDQLDNLGSNIYLKDYSGGLNTADSNEILKENESIIRKNWSNDQKGALMKVNGFTKKNSSAIASKAIIGLHRVYQSDGTKKLLAVCNTKLYYSDNDGTTFSQATNGTGLSASDINSFVNYNDLGIFTNKTDNLQKYTPGTNTMAAATDQPTDPCGVLKKRSDRRLIALNNDVNGATLYFSKVDPTGAAADDWSASNDAGSIAIDGALSERLISGITYGAYDIILKDYVAFKVWGYPTPQAVRMPGSPGCAAPYSVAQGDGLAFFLSHDAVWMWDGNSFIKISAPIEDVIDGMGQVRIINSFGVYRDGYYWLFYTSSADSSNQDCVIYDVAHSNPYAGENIWFERDGLSMNCPIVFNGPADANELYAGDSAATGFVYRLDYSSTGDDAGSNIKAIYQTKYFNANLPRLVKRYPVIHVRYYLSKGSITINWYVNRGLTSGSFLLGPTQTGVKLGSFTLGTDVLSADIESTHTERLPDNAVGKDISLKITSDDTGDSPIIRDIEIEWEGLYVL